MVSKEGTIEGGDSSFASLRATLERQTKSLVIQLTKDFSTDSISELESLLVWVADKVEVDMVVVRSRGYLHPRLAQLTSLPCEELASLLFRLRKLVIGMFYLPQTVVMDLEGEVCDLGAEFTLGADLRVAHNDLQVSWNMLERGRAPVSGGASLLPSLVGEVLARKWLLGGERVRAPELLHCGFLSLCYQRYEQEVSPFFERIIKQAPVARIQAKRALLENVMQVLERSEKIDESISRASLLVEDYRKEPGSFCSARDFSKIKRNVQ